MTYVPLALVGAALRIARHDAYEVAVGPQSASGPSRRALSAATPASAAGSATPVSVRTSIAASPVPASRQASLVALSLDVVPGPPPPSGEASRSGASARAASTSGGV